MSSPGQKHLFFILILLFPALSSVAQTWQWQTNNSKYLYQYTLLDSHSSTISVAYQSDRVVLQKHDKYGNRLWVRNIVNTSGIGVNSILGGIVVDNWDNIYFISEPIASIDSAQVNTPAPYALVKLNANGRFVWARTLNYTATIDVINIASSGDRIYITVSCDPFTGITYNGTTYPNIAGNSNTIFTAGVDTAGNARWTKRLYTSPSILSCNHIEAHPFVSVNRNNELLLTGQSTDKLFLESTTLIDKGSNCTSFHYGMVLDGNTGNTKWVKELPVDSLAYRPNTRAFYRQYISTILTNGNALLYRAITNDTTLSTNYRYSVELSNKLYQFDTKGDLIRKDSIGSLSNWYEIYSLKAGDSSQFFTTGHYHNFSLPAPVYEVRKWDTTVRAVWTKRVEFNQYFPVFSPLWDFDYRDKALSLMLGTDYTSINPYDLAYFGNDSIWPYGKQFLTRMVEGANFIAGTTFFDLNKNGLKDNNEPVAPGVMIGSANGDTIYTFSKRDGNYSFIAGPGSYELKPLNLPAVNPHYTISSPARQSAVVTGYGSFIRKKDFALQAGTPVTDGAISVSYSSIPRPGSTLNTKVLIKNTGTTNISGSYTIRFDSVRLSMIKSDSTPTLANARSITVPLNTLAPFGTAVNEIGFAIRTTAKAGDTIHISGQLMLTAADANPADNSDSSIIPVRSSFDPNDKQVYPFKDINYDSTVAGRQEIDYLIRFQNTGNDTAFTVQILDSLDKRLDASTFRLISSSHPVDVDWQKQRSLSFYFKDILLPDSNTNEPKSHGFVRFKIKPYTTVTLNDTIKNTAAIYFDYNSAVITGTTLSNFLKKTTLTATNDVERSSRYLTVKPNPVNQVLYYKLKQNNINTRMDLVIYDAAGRLVLSTSRVVESNREDGIDVSALKAGTYYFIMQNKQEIYLKSFIRL
jgi:hypothetical protein